MICETLEAVRDRRPAFDLPRQQREEDLERSTRILLVDDDTIMRHKIAGYLENHNVTTVHASGSQQMARLLATGEFGLAILDLPLGNGAGFDLLREIRSRARLPVIVTGCHREEADRAIALDLGADDYLSKPFSSRELLARMRAILRRRAASSFDVKPNSEWTQCKFGGWHFDRRARRLIDPNGKLVTLTKGEYALLTAFLAAPRRSLTREYLLNATRAHEDVFERSIDVQVMRLRRKLSTDPSLTRMIRSERGIGYVFILQVESF
jgi:two-component system, OmpR family, response regulator